MSQPLPASTEGRPNPKQRRAEIDRAGADLTLARP